MPLYNSQRAFIHQLHYEFRIPRQTSKYAWFPGAELASVFLFSSIGVLCTGPIAEAWVPSHLGARHQGERGHPVFSLETVRQHTIEVGIFSVWAHNASLRVPARETYFIANRNATYYLTESDFQKIFFASGQQRNLVHEVAIYLQKESHITKVNFPIQRFSAFGTASKAAKTAARILLSDMGEQSRDTYFLQLDDRKLDDLYERFLRAPETMTRSAEAFLASVKGPASLKMDLWREVEARIRREPGNEKFKTDRLLQTLDGEGQLAVGLQGEIFWFVRDRLLRGKKSPFLVTQQMDFPPNSERPQTDLALREVVPTSEQFQSLPFDNPTRGLTVDRLNAHFAGKVIFDNEEHIYDVVPIEGRHGSESGLSFMQDDSQVGTFYYTLHNGSLTYTDIRLETRGKGLGSSVYRLLHQTLPEGTQLHRVYTHFETRQALENIRNSIVSRDEYKTSLNRAQYLETQLKKEADQSGLPFMIELIKRSGWELVRVDFPENRTFPQLTFRNLQQWTN